VAPAPVERWDVDAHLAGLTVVVRRGPSEHLGTDLEGEVLAASGSGYPPRGPSVPAPPGTIVVERLYPGGGPAPVGYWVMVKQAAGFDPAGGDWEYLVVSPLGVVEQRGKPALCVRCHAEAPADHLFGRAR
jgi:hypothetical protein